MRNLKKKTCKYVLAALFFMLLATAIDVQTAQAAVKKQSRANLLRTV